jgi:hypothetical protein
MLTRAHPHTHTHDSMTQCPCPSIFQGILGELLLSIGMVSVLRLWASSMFRQRGDSGLPNMYDHMHTHRRAHAPW